MPPGTAIFTIQGYNYEEPIIIQRDGVRITPLQYLWNHNTMTYYITVAAPDGILNHDWQIQTSDFVEPVVNDGITGLPVQVSLLRRRYRFNDWSLKPSSDTVSL
jgi:hypothetical protein